MVSKLELGILFTSDVIDLDKLRISDLFYIAWSSFSNKISPSNSEIAKIIKKKGYNSVDIILAKKNRFTLDAILYNR